MVAITVILAAVIAAFVLDIGDTGEPVQANIDVSQGTGDNVTLTVTDATNVDSFTIEEDPCDDDLDGIEDEDNVSVGSSVTGECDDGDRLVIVGEVDGSESIVVDTSL